MGNLFARVLESLSGNIEKRILLLGLDAGGKVTLFLSYFHLFYLFILLFILFLDHNLVQVKSWRNSSHNSNSKFFSFLFLFVLFCFILLIQFLFIYLVIDWI